MKAWSFLALMISAVACGGSNNDLFEDPPAGGTGGSGGKGTGGSTGGASTGGAAGKGTGGTGTGGSATGGNGGTGGVTGGTGGSTGGTGTGGDAGVGTGGTQTGGTGTGGSTGGTGTGGDAGMGTGGTMAGGPAAGVGGGVSGAGGRGTGGNAGTGSTMTCEQLVQAYAKTLPDALVCNPTIDSVQCTEHLPSSLPCGCPIHVNPANEEAVAELTRLQQQHSKMGCIEVCGDVFCQDSEGVCTTMGNGGDGRCVESTASK